ncbi:MAG: hypothetical protein ACE5FV_10925 [Woeseia sp.]
MPPRRLWTPFCREPLPWPIAISVPGTLGFMLTGAGDPLLRAAGLGYVNFALISPATMLLAPLGARIAHGPSQRR